MTDFKFDINGKKLSSEEINSKKDFETFYKRFQVKSKSFHQKSWFWASAGFASVAISSMVMFGNPINQQNNLKKDAALITNPSNIYSINDNKSESFEFKTTSLNEAIIKDFNHIEIIFKKESNFCSLNKKWDYLEKDSIGLSENGKLPDKQLTKSPKISKSSIVIPDNLFQPQIPKVPKYDKPTKRRIQIQK